MHIERTVMRGLSKLMFAVLVGTAALYAGCGDSDSSDDQQSSADAGMMTDGASEGCEKKPPSMPAKHACWHVCAETPIEVDAAGEGDQEIPAVQFAKTYRISLSEGSDGQYTGRLRFDAAEDGREAVAEGETRPIHFFTVAEVSLAAEGAETGDELSMSESGGIQCDQGLSYEQVFEMEANSYEMTFGPTDREEVILVITPRNGPAFKQDK